MRSTTCTGSNGQFLEEYYSQSAASIAAEDIRERYGRNMTPMQCPKCNYWHLTSHTTRKQCMFCTDSALFLKDIYVSKEEAQQVADRLRRDAKVQLLPYKCPHGSGWHLTKKK